MAHYWEGFDAITKAKRLMEDAAVAAGKGTDPETDEEASGILLWVVEQLDKAKDDLEYISLPSQEGRLYPNERGRSVVHYSHGQTGPELTCGHSLEAFYGGEWHRGRVEHREEGYYFTGAGAPLLNTLGKIRIRG